MRVDTDKRSRDIEPTPQAKRAARRAFGKITAAETEAAKALATIERKRSYVLDGFRSVYAFAKSIGYGPQQTKRLLELGRTLLDEEDLEEKIKKGDVPAETAAQIGRMFRDPKVNFGPQQKAEWKDKAQNQDPDKVRNDAEQATEDAHQGEPTFLMRFRVIKATRDGFRRARDLMARGQAVFPTDGEVLGRIVEFYLEKHDPKEMPLPKRPKGKGKGKGRAGGRRRSRKVPERVKATVRRRSGGTCELCGTRRACQLVHLVPFAKGGSNEASNIVDGCRDCHVLYDAGVYTFSHFDESGKSVFVLDRDRLASFQRRQRDQEDGEDQAGASSVHEPAPRYGRERHEAPGDRDGASFSVRERPPPPYGSRRRGKRPTMATGPP